MCFVCIFNILLFSFKPSHCSRVSRCTTAFSIRTRSAFLSLCCLRSGHWDYMFCTLLSVFLGVSPSVLASEICVHDISSIYWWISSKLVHLGTEMNWLGFGVIRSTVTVAEASSTRRCHGVHLSSLTLQVRKTPPYGDCGNHDLNCGEHLNKSHLQMTGVNKPLCS